MVLRNTPPIRDAGLTLVEVLTAMAVAAITVSLAFGFNRDFSKVLRKVWTQFHRGNAQDAWVATLQRGLVEGRGLIEIWPEGLVFANRQGTPLRLEKNRSDSSMIWNGKPLPWNFENFKIDALGPDCGMESAKEEKECQSLMDSLDWNGDRKVDLDELDRNRDGKLSGREIRYVRVVEIRWKAAGERQEHRLALHPRSRVVL